MRGKRGIWTVGIVVLVSLAMGIATWPLLKARKKNQEQRTWLTLRNINAMRRTMEAERRRPLADLKELGLTPDELRDAWGRPIQFRPSDPSNQKGSILWSLGHNPDDPSDDLILSGTPVP